MSTTSPNFHTYFQDTLQTVPQLLECCVLESIRIKDLRLVCKTSSTVALQAVHTYCIKLFPEPSVTEPLQDVARILQQTQLKQLRVELNVADLYPIHHGVRPYPDPLPHELTSQLEQLREFLSVMRTALRSVTSVEITLNLCKRKLSSQYNYSPWVTMSISELRAEAGSEFASLLTAACPLVCRVGISGGLGDDAMRLFGTSWPQLTTLDIQGCMWVRIFGALEGDILFPSVTRMRMVDTQRCQDDFMDIARCVFITHLEVGDGWLEGDQSGWLLLPPNLQMLRCGQVPNTLPPLLRLDHLTTIHITDSRTSSINVEILASLLRAAPALELLVTLHSVWDTISVISCLPSVLEDLQLVGKRISAGFRFEGIESLPSDWSRLPPQRRSVSGSFPGTGSLARPLPNALDLGRPPVAYTLKACDFQPWEHDGRGADCLAMLASSFPNLESLTLGPLMHDTWQDASLNESLTFSFPNVRSLDSKDEVLPGTAVLQLVACMPQLTQLTHWGKMDGEELEALHMRLIATQTVTGAEENACAPKLGDWTLTSPSLWSTEWTRTVFGTGPPA